jgi:hypothetical protein
MIDHSWGGAPGSPQRMEPQGRERHRWVKPRGRTQREQVSQSVLWRTRDECSAFGAKDALGNSIGRLVDNVMLTINLHS